MKTAELRVWVTRDGWAWNLTSDIETVGQGGHIKSEESARNIATGVAKTLGYKVVEMVDATGW